MSFEVLDHVSNRVRTYAISDFLDHTAGKAVRAVGYRYKKDLQISDEAIEFVASEVSLGLVAALAGIRNKRFSTVDAAVAFCVGQLPLAIKSHLKKHKHHFMGHLLTDDDWATIEGLVASEFVAGVHAVMRPATRR